MASMGEVVRWISDDWLDWFPNETAVPSLRWVIQAGGPAHRGRGSYYVFAGREPTPRLIVKVGSSERERRFVAAEHGAMSAVRKVVAKELEATIPVPLGIEHWPNRTAMATLMMPGRRLLVPFLPGPGSTWAARLFRRYTAGCFRWARRLAASGSGESADEASLAEVAERFAADPDVPSPTAEAARSFGGALTRARVRWEPTWQHGDVSVGNLLMHRRRLRFLDWEHASPTYPPWLDIAFSPAAALVLAWRQQPSGSFADMAGRILARNHWVGSVLASEMDAAWRGFPLPITWAVTLTAMETALRQGGEDRHGKAFWSDFVSTTLTDDVFRRQVGWLSPEW